MDPQGVVVWRTSTYTGNGGGTCIEVGQVLGRIAIRDTKDHGTGHVLTATTATWQSFTDSLK